jgi:ABC-2 type transport system ATP-binding protein
LTAVIEIENLHKSYGKTYALRGVSFEVEPGIFGLLGPNGAGKTTLIRVLLGLLKPDQGRVRVFGYDCTTESLDVRRRLGYLSEDHRFYEYMRGAEYLEFVGLARGLGKGEVKARVKAVLEAVNLSDAGRKKIKEYSQGMKQRLALAQALLGYPQLLILDEPTANLDPIGRHDFLKIIRRVGEEGATVLLSSHILGEVERVCDALAFLNKGQLVYRGRWSALQEEFPGLSLQDIFIRIITGGEG